jgi:hypothetical protein
MSPPPYSRGTQSRALAATRLREMSPGDGMILPLPPNQPGRRRAVQRVNDICHHLWGPGHYSLRSGPDGVVVMLRHGVGP